MSLTESYRLVTRIVSSKRGLQIDGQWVPCEVNRKTDMPKLLVEKTVIIPANSEVVIGAKGENMDNIETRYAVLEPMAEDKRKLIVARELLDPRQSVMPVRLVNLEDHSVKLKKNYLLGELHCIKAFEEVYESTNNLTEHVASHICRLESNVSSEVQSFNEQSDDGNFGERADIPELPTHLQELYERTSKNIPSKDNRKQLAELLVRNEDAFAKNKIDLGSCSVIKHKIDTAESAPIRQPLRRTPIGFEGEEEKYLREQIDQGVIRPSKSPWASPVVLVRKKDNSVRWCIDYRRLNEVTLKDAYPLPRIDMCLDCLASATIFSCLDLQSGYWQIELEDKDQPKTAFITKYGLYEYTKMPFGLCNAPSTFQRCMELIFRGLQWQTLLIYLDDIIILSSDMDEHFQHIDEVLKRLQQVGLKLKPSKCEFIKEEILYLGHVVTKSGIKPNPKIVEAVKTGKNHQMLKKYNGS